MIEALLGGAFGLLFGSFLNVCIYRWSRDLSVVQPRSFCPSCQKTIAWYDNVPILSYILLRGRCRHCGAGIAVRYLLVEIATGLFFALAAYRYGLNLGAVRWATYSALLIGLIASDLEEYLLPDQMTLGGIVAGSVLRSLRSAYAEPLPGGNAMESERAAVLRLRKHDRRCSPELPDLGRRRALFPCSPARRPGLGRRQDDRHVGGIFRSADVLAGSRGRLRCGQCFRGGLHLFNEGERRHPSDPLRSFPRSFRAGGLARRRCDFPLVCRFGSVNRVLLLVRWFFV